MVLNEIPPYDLRFARFSVCISFHWRCCTHSKNFNFSTKRLLYYLKFLLIAAVSVRIVQCYWKSVRCVDLRSKTANRPMRMRRIGGVIRKRQANTYKSPLTVPNHQSLPVVKSNTFFVFLETYCSCS